MRPCPADRSRIAKKPSPDAPLPAAATLLFGSRLLGATRLGAFAAMIILAVPAQLVVLRLAPGAWPLLPRLFHRLTATLMGVEIECVGEISRNRPTLFVSNHASYLDIILLGTMLTASFVAKADVAGWPIFGLLSKLQRTVFIDRRRGSAHRHRDELQARLAAGDNLVLFPEGTSSDGNRVLPFRSALLSVAEPRNGAQPLVVQPISISYTSVNGLPLGRELRPLVAWYGAMELGPHLWRFAGLGRVRAVIEFHPPVRIGDLGSRKELARHCAEEVANGLSRALTGRRSKSPARRQEPLAVNALVPLGETGQNRYTGRSVT